ncbi:MAG: catechol 1,2-dioxygenase [Pseudomonadota bacterium]|nr:catechol 1,2-dioxygenase [Pseudomonadota bacterium]
MPVIKVKDIAYGRLRSPDLDVQEEFLTEFGMVRVERTNDALYMRGTDGDQFVHVTHKADKPSWVGFAYNAASEEDLEIISKVPGATGIENMDEPGGGKRVRLTEPNGFQIEIVHGQAKHDPIPVRFQKLNMGPESENRAGELMRIDTGKSRVKRIGHGVMGATNLKETVAWFRETLGFIGSDDVYAGQEDNLMGSFSRCDQGENYVDHHVFFCIQSDHAGLNHLSYEVADVDDVFTGHEYLKGLDKYEHMWGLGRHILGSQIFDYWADPYGRVHEHWSDSDRLNVANGSNLIAAEEGLGSQWGEPAPQKFIDRILA